jgi:hypothetical protein
VAHDNGRETLCGAHIPPELRNDRQKVKETHPFERGFDNPQWCEKCDDGTFSRLRIQDMARINMKEATNNVEKLEKRNVVFHPDTESFREKRQKMLTDGSASSNGSSSNGSLSNGSSPSNGSPVTNGGSKPSDVNNILFMLQQHRKK